MESDYSHICGGQNNVKQTNKHKLLDLGLRGNQLLAESALVQQKSNSAADKHQRKVAKTL
jgi:hypothetical protein